MDDYQVELTHSDSEVISWWSTTITSLVNPANNRPKNLLVFINPFGGHGTAKQIWENKVAPVFSVAGIACKVIVTESSDHAETVIQSSTLDNYQGIISVGGDGMFSQVTRERVRERMMAMILLDIQRTAGADCPGQQA